MPDLLAGTIISAADYPPEVSDAEAGFYTFTITSFGITAASGTYVDCGVAFTAPTTGRVTIEFGAQVTNSGANATIVSPVVRAGSTVGSGASVFAAADDWAVTFSGTDTVHAQMSRPISGLTPGDAYNVRLEHRVAAGTGSAQYRHVKVESAS